MINAANILVAKHTALKNWHLKDMPPFHGVPSGNLHELMNIFVDREEEVTQALLTLDKGENVLVRGMVGIGKTAFIMAVLYQMEKQYNTIGHELLPIHIRQFSGCTREDLQKIIVYSLAKRLAPRDKTSREILSAITGEEITQSRSRGLNVGFEVQIPQIFAAKTGGEVGGDISTKLNIELPEYYLEKLLNIAIKKKGYKRVVIAIDDLERAPNQHSIKAMLESSLDLLRDHNSSFILTGRTLTILEDVYASASGLNIFNTTIPLKPLTPEQLRQVAVNTLNVVREANDYQSVDPFTDEVIRTISSRSFGIPRQFMVLCSKILDIAIEKGTEKLDSEAFEIGFAKFQDELAQREVPPDIRRVLYLGLQQGGFSIAKDADLDKVFEVLGVTTLRQFVDFADNLVHQDMLQRFTDSRGEVLYRLVPGIEKLAMSGKPD
ncbi:MAG: ATP-binding protein [Anaerolineae bacterium]|nr:ATP-binding protein [Anaerolineae bacterium]